MPDVAVRETPAGAQGSGPAAGHRQRLTDAITRVAAERGYQATDAAQVAAFAGLSAEDFHACFSDKDQCLLAAYDRFLERLAAHIEEECADVAGWAERVEVAITAGFEFLAELDTVARLFAVDLLRTGAAGLERRRAAIDHAALLLREGRLLYPDAGAYPDAMERTLVAGIVLAATTHLLDEDIARLPSLAAEAVELALAPYRGAARPARRR